MSTTSATSPDALAPAGGSTVSELPELEEADDLVIPSNINLESLPDTCIPDSVLEVGVPMAEPDRGTEEVANKLEGGSEDLPPISPDKEARLPKLSSQENAPDLTGFQNLQDMMNDSA